MDISVYILIIFTYFYGPDLIHQLHTHHLDTIFKLMWVQYSEA